MIRTRWLAAPLAWLALLPCLPAPGAALVAFGDQAATLHDTPVTIPVLANDSAGGTNQTAILKVTAPAHGTVTINTNNAVPGPELARLYEFAGRQLSNSVVQIANSNLYPRATRTNGLWVTNPLSGYNWVAGFFPGSLWYYYQHSGDAQYRTWAESWTAGIAPQQYVTTIPDTGFMINNSFGMGYGLTGNTAYRPVVVQAAQSMVAGCYNTRAGCIGQLWAPNELAVAIDWTMNLELLFHAAILNGDRTLSNNAVNSALTTMLNHVRPDGSTWMMSYYNATTGALIGKGTSAGASDNSTWARGHAWGIYGFSMVYRETGDVRFLATAQKLADYYLANVPADYVPYWDFQAPGIPNAPRDSSAASITLAALVQLSQLATNLQDSARYCQGARHIFSSLGSTNYLSKGMSSSGILLQGTGEPPQFQSPEVDVSLIYGDYYFIEAMRRYTELFRRTSLTYIPNPGFQGTDSFTYQACDDGGNCSTAVVPVVVEPATPTPFSMQISFTNAIAPGSSVPMVLFPTTAGRRYQVEYRADLGTLSRWIPLGATLAGSGSPMMVTDTNPASPGFYRVVVQ